jgi:hypothetical protein
MAHTGRYGNALTIYNADGNGSSPGVRMTYQGRNLTNKTDPENLPNSAYYSAWFFIPEHVSVGQQSGWNIFQWKTGYFNGTQRTARALYWHDLDDYGNELYLELFTRVNSSGTWVSGWADNIAVSPIPVPIGQWFHLESYYKWDSTGNGRVTSWLDGVKIWDIGGLTTEFDWPYNVYKREWTVNNYARETTPTTHTLYVDDAAVSTTRLGPVSASGNTGTTGKATCAGLEATIVGTAGNDVLNGTSGRDIIAGLAGNDVIRGRGGNDVICGGRGRDTIAAGAGNDTARGGPGRDTIYGEDGDDLIVAKPGDDSIFGGTGRDRCHGGAGTDTASGCESERSIP